MNDEIKVPNLKYDLTVYFDNLVNTIDIFIETRLQTLMENKICSSDVDKKNDCLKFDYFNVMRNDLLTEIDFLKQENMLQCNATRTFIFLVEVSENYRDKICLIKSDIYFTEKETEILKYIKLD